MVLNESSQKLKKEDKAPEFSLPSTDGKTISLSDFNDAKAILIIFMCNHCPYVKAKLSDLNKIASTFKNQGLVTIGINSNESANYPDDSFENMKKEVSSGNIQFIYLHDESQEIAKSYGASCTPDPFLFDSKQRLIFHSRIGDPPSPEPSKVPELFEAIQEFLNSGTITAEEQPSVGCSIKWK
jgi:peroxiredoxin